MTVVKSFLICERKLQKFRVFSINETGEATDRARTLEIMNSPDSDQIAVEVEKAYASYGQAIFRFALRLTGHRDDAEDIVVETFAHAYRQWAAFRGKGSRKAWLFGIAINRFRMGRRRARPSTEPLRDEALHPGLDAMELIALQMEIAKLPPKQREAFLLVKGEGLTAREAAEALGRPIGTVLSEIFYAVRALRGALSETSAPSIACEAER